MKNKIVSLCFSALLCIPAKSSTVVVHGDKISTNPLEVPASYVEINEQDLNDAGIENVRDAAQVVPNFQIVGSSSSRYITPFVRGQGNQDLNRPDDVSVTFYLDEVPLPRYAFESELIDIQKIEVLRGPQGTLFGKNTQAGAILIESQEPLIQEKYRHEVGLGFGNQGQRSVKGKTNYHLFSKKVKARTAFSHKERDGWIKDTVLNKDLGERETDALHQAIVFEPKSGRKLTLKLGAQRETGNDPFFISRHEDQFPITGHDIEPDYRRDLLTSSLKWEESLTDSSLLTFITSYNYYDFGVKYDEADYYVALDYLLSQVPPSTANALINNPDVLFRDIKEYDRQFFNEIRLKSQLDQATELSMGLNFSQKNYRLINHVNTYSPGPKTIDQNIQLKGKNISAFSQLSKQVFEDWTFTAGARFNYDQKQFISEHSSTDLASYQQNSTESYTDFTGKLSAAYEWSENKMSYASLSRGYQPGGYPSFQFNNYSGVAEDQKAYGKSSSLAYEIGHKTKLFNDHLSFNTSLFYNQIKDKQVRVKDPASNISYYENADSDIFGAELETVTKLHQNLRLGVSAGYTNSRFSETIKSDQEVVLSNNDRLANVPYWNASSYLQYSKYVGVISSFFTARIAYSYMGQRWGENTNLTKLPSYGLWKMNLSLVGARWRGSLKVENIFDKVYDSQAYYYTSLNKEVTSPGLPRLAKIEVSYRF